MKEEIYKELEQLGSSLIEPKYKDIGFVVPDGYFENLEQRCEIETIGNISEEFEVPDGYFENLENRISTRIQDEESARAKNAKIISLNRPRVVGLAASITALIFMATWLFRSSEIRNESTSDLLVEVETSDLIDYLHETDTGLMDELLGEYDFTFDDALLGDEMDELLNDDDIDNFINQMSIEELEDLL